MRRERRQLTRRELAAITSKRPVVRIHELAEEGYSRRTIAAKAGFSEEVVRRVLEPRELDEEAS